MGSELMNVPCEVALSQVDYRAYFYSFYLTLALPATEVVSYCVQ